MKKNISRIIVNGIVAISFIFLPISVNAGYIGTPSPEDDPNIVSATCSETFSTEYDPIGDTRGHSVLTKKETYRDCNVTKRVEGECIKWEEDRKVAGLGPDEFNVYENNHYEDALGTLMAMLGAYDQMEHLWSGFKGYCIIGTLQDFAWASDPMFWSSMALSYFMSTDSGKEAFDAAVSEGIEVAAQAGIEISKLAARCMVTAAAGALSAGFDYITDEADAADCDPVDEICETGEEATDESEIMTMDKVQFEDMVEQVAQDGESTDLYDMIQVIDDGSTTGVVTFRLNHMNEMKGIAEMDQEGMEEMQNKLKEFKLYLGLAMSAANFGMCMVSGGNLGNNVYGGSPGSDDRASLRNGIMAGIDFASKFLGPYGPIIAVALKLIAQIAMSFSDVDTCNDEEDAEKQGSRHLKTYKSLSFDLCHAIGERCVDEWVIVGGCCLQGYDYCCYDQVLTKVLVEQIKAQLPRDWAHCAGISLSDLNYISFRQCSDSQIQDPDSIDGAHQYIVNTDPDNPTPYPGYDLFNAFQYKFHCIDMTEFKEYLEDLMGEEIDMDTFDDYWDDLTRQGAN